METHQADSVQSPAWLSIFTWITVLLVSDLTNAVWLAITGDLPTWLFWLKTGLLVLVILISLVWKPIQPVRAFFILLLVLTLSLWGMSWLRTTPGYRQWEAEAGWVEAMAAYQLLKLLVVLIMVMTLFLIGRRWKEFFFTRGELNAPIKARSGEENQGKRSISWGTLGLILGLCIAPLTLLFFGLGEFPPADILAKALPYFPLAILFAITNSFAEEAQFRASLLGDLKRPLGDGNAIWITATFFGFAHYFGGAPSGIPGVLIAGLLGALFARCMLGSKGIVVPWFIHFCQNAVIYAFWAIAAMS